MKHRPLSFEPPLIGSLDIGSSSVRAMVFDRTGKTVEGLHSTLVHRVKASSDGGAELDADAVLQRTSRCLVALSRQADFKRCRPHLAAVSCSMFMHTLVGADRNGRAITPLFMWSDTRSRGALAHAARTLDARAVHQSTGCPLHTSYPFAKLVWLRHTQPGLFRRVHRWLSMGDYLHLRLFGRPTLSCSMASASGLFSHRSLQWDEAMLAAAGVQAEQLGELVDFDDRSIGLVTPYCRRLAAFADLPWFPAMADGVCSNLGSGCVDESRFALNLGTSGALRAISPRSNRRVPEGLFCYVVDRDRRLLGGAISNCGNLRRWLLDTIQPGGDLDRQLPRMEPDAHGLTMLPFLAGERAPFWPADATGAILGLRASSTPLDIVRAGLDAVCYQLALIHARLRTTLHRTRCIVASGGGSASDWWMQMMADTADIPVRRSGVAEASSRGAALLALEALGVIRASKQVPSPRGRTFVPNAERGLTYRRALNRYTRFCELLSAKLEDRFSSLRRVVSL